MILAMGLSGRGCKALLLPLPLEVLADQSFQVWFFSLEMEGHH